MWSHGLDTISERSEVEIIVRQFFLLRSRSFQADCRPFRACCRSFRACASLDINNSAMSDPRLMSVVTNSTITVSFSCIMRIDWFHTLFSMRTISVSQRLATTKPSLFPAVHSRRPTRSRRKDESDTSHRADRKSLWVSLVSPLAPHH